MMPWTADTVRQHADEAFRRLIDVWLKAGDPDPIGFLYLPDGTCGAVPQVGAYPQEALPGLMRGAASEFGAAFAGLVVAARFIESSPEDAERWYAAGRTLVEHPGARDCLVYSVDGPGLSVCMMAWKNAEGALCVEVSDKPLHGRMSNLSGRLGEN